jgi:hypothetical protein
MEGLSCDQGREESLAGFRLRLTVSDAALAVFNPEAVVVHLEDVNLMGEAIEQRAG